MNGQLWQACFCGTEPVCTDCERCRRHCRCPQQVRDREEIRAFDTAYPGLRQAITRHHEQGAQEQ